MLHTLSTLEERFLNTPAVSTAVDYESLKRTIADERMHQLTGFVLSRAKATHVGTFLDWIDSEQGKDQLAEAGLSWTKKDIAQKVFGYEGTSPMYKLNRLRKLEDPIVDAYLAKCREDDCTPTVEKCLKFANVVNDSDLTGDETALEILEAVNEQEEQETEQESNKAETIYTLTMKMENGNNVAWRIDSENVQHTRNSKDELLTAIETLKLIIETL